MVNRVPLGALLLVGAVLLILLGAFAEELVLCDRVHHALAIVQDRDGLEALRALDICSTKE